MDKRVKRTLEMIENDVPVKDAMKQTGVPKELFYKERDEFRKQMGLPSLKRNRSRSTR